LSFSKERSIHNVFVRRSSEDVLPPALAARGGTDAILNWIIQHTCAEGCVSGRFSFPKIAVSNTTRCGGQSCCQYETRIPNAGNHADLFSATCTLLTTPELPSSPITRKNCWIEKSDEEMIVMKLTLQSAGKLCFSAQSSSEPGRCPGNERCISGLADEQCRNQQ
jgi:hypothetical protein